MPQPWAPAAYWLPPGKTCAVTLSVDDVHPGSARDAYEAGGDLAHGALGRLAHLQARHPQLKATLCVTPDWRLKSLVPDGWLLRHIPGLRRRVHWTRRHPPGHFRVDRYPNFIEYLNGLPRCEVVLHGLTHSHPGRDFAVEFQDQDEAWCRATVLRGLEIFEQAGLHFVRGYVPPAWNAPSPLLAALDGLDFDFICSSRDLRTPIEADARTAMSGLHGRSLLHPDRLGPNGMVHIGCNFQATSSIDRAFAILEHGGLLHIKSHVFKAGGGHVMLDGLDALYCNYLDVLLSQLTQTFGDRLWWPHLSDVAGRVRAAA